MNATILLALLLGLALGGTLIYGLIALKNKGITTKANKLIEEAKKEAEKLRKEQLLEIKEESSRLKQDVEKEIKERKEELLQNEERLLQREASLDKRDEMLQTRDQMIEEKEQNILAKQKEIQSKEEELTNLLKEEMTRLEKISKFSQEKAKELIMKRTEEEISLELAQMMKEKEDEAKLTANEKAKQLIIESMQRYSADVATEQTVSTINLPNDEMKGRLIGREGRNIRTIEAVTGVDLIIDDTPETIVVSSFDPLRREIAKITIESLMKDGRIHPSAFN